MLRLCLLAALAAVSSAHYFHPGSRSFDGVDLSPYWQPEYCAPIKLRYPRISDLTCYYIVYYYVHSLPSKFVSHLSLPGISEWSEVPQQYWVKYLSELVDLLPVTFYSSSSFRATLYSHFNDYYGSVAQMSLYHDHLALTDSYFCRNLVAPYSWKRFRPFYDRYVLKLGGRQSSFDFGDSYTFPGLRWIISSLKSYGFRKTRPYFRTARVKSLYVGGTKLVYPRPPIIGLKKLWFPRAILLGLNSYLKKIKLPWGHWFSNIEKIPSSRHVKWGSDYSGLVCRPKYHHLNYLCPAWDHGLGPLFKLRYVSYPETLIDYNKISFTTFIGGFLKQWRPKYEEYGESLVTSALESFDSYACGFLSFHSRIKSSHCRPKELWYPTFFKGFKDYKCHSDNC